MSFEQQLVDQGRYIQYEIWQENEDDSLVVVLPLSKTGTLRCSTEVVTGEVSEFTIAGSSLIGPAGQGSIAVSTAVDPFEDPYEPHLLVSYDLATNQPMKIEVSNLGDDGDELWTPGETSPQREFVAAAFKMLTDIDACNLPLGSVVDAPDELYTAILHNSARKIAPYISFIQSASADELADRTDLYKRAGERAGYIAGSSYDRRQMLLSVDAPQMLIENFYAGLRETLKDLADPANSRDAHTIIAYEHARLAIAHENMDGHDSPERAIEHWQESATAQERLASLADKKEEDFIDAEQRAGDVGTHLQLAGLSYAYAAQNAAINDGDKKRVAELNQLALRYLNPRQWGFYQILEGRPLLPGAVIRAALTDYDSTKR